MPFNASMYHRSSLHMKCDEDMSLPPHHRTDLQHLSALPLTLSLSVCPSSARPQLCTAGSVRLLGSATSPSSERKGRARATARVPGTGAFQCLLRTYDYGEIHFT